MNITDRIDSFEKRIVRMEAQKEEVEKEIARLTDELAAIDIDLLKESAIVLGKLSEKQRAAAKAKLEELCTFALQYSISPDLESKIELTTLRGKPAAQLFIVNNATGVRTTPVAANGGGIVDIVSTAIRFVITEVWRDPFINGPMILDEAYKHLSKEYTALIAEFLKTLSTDFDRQIILSTHNDFIAQSADKRIHVSLDDAGHSKISYGDKS